MTTTSKTTLVVFGEDAPFSRALKQVHAPDAASSPLSIMIRPLPPRPASSSSSSTHAPGFLPGQVIATSLGVSFLYCDHADAIPAATPSSSFAAFVCLVNLPKVNATAHGNNGLQLLQARAPTNAMFCLVHNAEEAAEFVLSMTGKLSDPGVRAQAQRMSMEANTAAATATDAAEQAFAICERAFPIPTQETRALLESAGSLLELCQMKDSQEIAARSPLSNSDACKVAELLGLPVVVASATTASTSMPDSRLHRRFF